MSKKSKIFQAQLTYFEYVTRRDDFKSKLTSIRKKYGIPASGFESKEEADKILKRIKVRLPFDEWIEFVEAPGLALDFHLLSEEIWRLPLIDLIVFDRVNFDEYKNILEYAAIKVFCHDMVQSSPARELELDNIVYPVNIKISPYASRNEILNFIERRYRDDIKPIQERWKNPKVLIGKLRGRKKEILERNDFIMANKDRKPNEIMKLLRKNNLKIISYSDISAIISKEKKRRT
ncbi:MAG: hypothetical protein ACYC5G_01075 [Candidatus Doudnabacteria bacterium]